MLEKERELRDWLIYAGMSGSASVLEYRIDQYNKAIVERDEFREKLNAANTVNDNLRSKLASRASGDGESLAKVQRESLELETQLATIQSIVESGKPIALNEDARPALIAVNNLIGAFENKMNAGEEAIQFQSDIGYITSNNGVLVCAASGPLIGWNGESPAELPGDNNDDFTLRVRLAVDDHRAAAKTAKIAADEDAKRAEAKAKNAKPIAPGAGIGEKLDSGKKR